VPPGVWWGQEIGHASLYIAASWGICVWQTHLVIVLSLMIFTLQNVILLREAWKFSYTIKFEELEKFHC